jgi:hypothetical protein
MASESLFATAHHKIIITRMPVGLGCVQVVAGGHDVTISLMGNRKQWKRMMSAAPRHGENRICSRQE